MITLPVYDALIAELSHGIIIVDDAYKIHFINKWFIDRSLLTIQLGMGIEQLSDQPALMSAVTKSFKFHHPSILSQTFNPYPFKLKRETSDQLMNQRVAIRAFDAEERTWVLIEISDYSAIVDRQKFLNEAREYLDTILNAVAEGVIVFDANGFILNINPAAESIFAVERRFLIGKNLEIILPKEGQALNDMMTRAQQGDVEPKELSGCRSNQSEVSLWVSLGVFTRSNKQIFTAVIVDITKRKETEQILAEQQAQLVAQSKLSSLGEMAVGIGHEINNPIAAIKTTIALLKMEVDSEELSRNQVVALCTRLEGMADRVAKIVRSLKVIARSSERDPFIKAYLGEIVEDVFAVCLERFGKNSIDFEYSGLESDLEISCRPSEIGQVLLNLLSNAFDAIENLPQKIIKVEVTALNGSIEIKISDNGPGIPPEIADNIFTPFFTTKDPGKGTGLGLSISAKIIENHKGKLLIKRIDNFTCFVISLPVELGAVDVSC